MLWWTLRKLKSPDHFQRSLAVGTLARSADPDAFRALVDCLRMWDSVEVRRTAAIALTHKCDDRAIKAVAAALALENDEVVAKKEIEVLSKAGWFSSVSRLEGNPGIVERVEQYGSAELRSLAALARTVQEARDRESAHLRQNRSKLDSELKEQRSKEVSERVDAHLIELMTSLTSQLTRNPDYGIVSSWKSPPHLWRELDKEWEERRRKLIETTVSSIVAVAVQHPSEVCSFINRCVDDEVKWPSKFKLLFDGEVVSTALRALAQFNPTGYSSALIRILDRYLATETKRAERLVTCAKFAAIETGKIGCGENLPLAWRCEEEIRRTSPLRLTRPKAWHEAMSCGEYRLWEDPSVWLTRALRQNAVAVPDDVLSEVLTFQDGPVEIMQYQGGQTTQTGRTRNLSFGEARAVAKAELQRRAAIRTKLALECE